jgi:excisionase family DNA binding protein
MYTAFDRCSFFIRKAVFRISAILAREKHHPKHTYHLPAASGRLRNIQKGSQLPMSNQNQQVTPLPIDRKLLLSIREAAEYSNIGINKIDEMLKLPNCPFVLFVGTKKLVKRKAFEEFIEGKVAI